MDRIRSRTIITGCRGEVCVEHLMRDAELTNRLSQMILDQVFFGVLNESEGTLEVYDEPVEDVSWDNLCNVRANS